MTDRTKLTREIAGLLAGATEAQLLKAREALRPPSLVELADFAAFMSESFNTVDTYATGRIWLALLRTDDPRIERYDSLNGASWSVQERDQLTAATASRWRLSVNSIVAAARALSPYGDDMRSLRDALLGQFDSPITKTEHVLLQLWSASLTSD